MDSGEPTLFSVQDSGADSGTVDRETQHAGGETQHAASLQVGDVVMGNTHVDVETRQDGGETRQAASLQTGKGDLAASESEGRRLVKILMFYDDHTFEEYYPRS